jgi:hypothetical protein
MTLSDSSGSLLRAVVAGAIANAGVGPALAAPSFTLPFDITDITTLPARDILLWASVALLVAALIAKVIRDRYRRQPPPQGPDLRWRKNPPPSPQP